MKMGHQSGGGKTGAGAELGEGDSTNVWCYLLQVFNLDFSRAIELVLLKL